MRQADGSDLLGANDPRSSSIGIIYVAPGDDRPSVLEAILMQDKLGRKQVAVVLPENNRAFQRPVDFDGLKNLRRGLKSEIIFVAPGSPGPADFARQRRFDVYTSLDNYRSSLRAEQPDNSNGKKGLPLFNRRPKLVPGASAPAPLETFDEPASPPPQPYEPPVIPLSVPAPNGALPIDEDAVTVENEHVPAPIPVPVEPVGVTDDDISTLDTSELANNGRMEPSPAAQQDAGQYGAPLVPMPLDDDEEPVHPRSKSGPIPIPLTLSQTGARTKPLAPEARGANGSAVPVRSGNTGKRAAIGAAVVGAGAAAAFAATRTPATGGGQPPITGNASGSGGGGGGRPRRSRRQLLALILVILTLLLLAGIAFASPPGQNLLGHVTGSTVTATVTITPDHSTVSDSFVVTAVTGTPNPAAQQVQARFISYTSPSQSASARSTGSLPGANATGTLTFVYAGTASGVNVSGGTLVGASGVPISFGSFFLPFGEKQVLGTAVNQGVAGNIPARDIDGECCGNSNIHVQNNAFSGGQNPLPNSVITQHDINTASNNLIAKIKPSAQAGLQRQVHSNEQVVNNSLKCTTNVTPNHPAGYQATSVTVTGTATCTEEVFDQTGALALTSNGLKAEVTKKPQYTGYALVGNVVTNITSQTVIDTKGTVSLVIAAQGEWVYQFTPAILTAIKNKLAKESQSKAQADLNAYPGVMSATIVISSGSTMPDAADITIKVVPIPGLTGSPTPTPTTPPSGTTPTPIITPTTGLGNNGATTTPTPNLGGS